MSGESKAPGTGFRKRFRQAKVHSRTVLFLASVYPWYNLATVG